MVKKDLQMVISVQNKTIKELDRIQKSLTSLGKTVDAISQKSTTSFGKLTTAFASGGIISNYLVRAFDALGSSLVSLAKDSLEMTGQFRQSQVTFYNLAASIGWTADEIKNMQKFLQDSNKDAATSLEIMKKLALANIEASNAEALLTRGRDLADAVNKNSNEVIMKMTEAVATGNGQLMRQLGIMVDVGPAIENYANKHKMSADEVRKNYRQAAIFDEIMLQSIHTIGSYDLAMDSWYKKMNSAKDMLGNVKLTIGQLLDGAMKPMIEKIYEGLKAFTSWALEVDGTLKPQLIVLRNVIGLVTEGIFNLLWVVGELIAKGLKWLLDWIEKDIKGMNWMAKTIQGLSNFFVGLYKTIQTGFVTLGAFGDTLIGLGKIIYAFVKDGINNFKNFGEILKKVFGGIWKAVTGDFKGAWDDVKNIVKDSLSNTIEEFNNFGKGVEENAKAIEISANEAADAWGKFFNMEGMDEMIKKFQEGDVGGLFDAFINMFKDVEKTAPKASKKTKDAIEDLLKSMEDVIDKIGDIKKATEDEAMAFIRSQLEKKMSFDERLADMIASHKEAWQQANKDREELEKKGIKSREDLEKLAELRAKAQKEFGIIQPFLNRSDLQRLSERSDIERLTEGFRREQAEDTVEQGRKREEAEGKARGLVINFEFKDTVIGDQNFIQKVKTALNQALAEADITQ